MSFSDIILKRPVAVTTFIFALMVMGVFSYIKLDLEFLPDVDMPYVTIRTNYPGASPKEVETLVSRIIEDSISEVDGIKHVRSTSMENVSQVLIEFKMGTNVDLAAIDVREKVDLIKKDLPEDADPPIVLKFDPNAAPVMNIVLTGKKSMSELYLFADDVISDNLTKIPGVASVEIIGGKRREIQILLNRDKLIAYKLSINQITQAVKKANMNLPVGRITEEYYEYTIRMDGEFDTVEQIKTIELQIQTNKGIQTLPLTDIATIKDDFEEQRDVCIYNGKEAVGMTIKRRSDANIVTVVKLLTKEVQKLRANIPKDINLTIINEKAAFIKHSVSNVLESMFLGIIFTSIVLFLFLYNLRAAIIASISMPVSVISTFILIYFADFTINTMSLMALGISIGILVSNSIIMIEGIHQQLMLGEDSITAAKKGMNKVFLAILGSTMTNIVVFLPIVFMKTMVGQFFKEFGLTITFATIVSLFISITLTPLLTSRLFRSKKLLENIENPTGFFYYWDRIYTGIAKSYGVFFGKIIHRRALVLGTTFIVFIFAMQIPKYLGSEMTTEPDQSEFSILVEMPSGYSLEQTKNTFKLIDKVVQDELKDILKKRYVKIGKISGLFGKSSQGVHLGEMLVIIKDKGERKQKILDILEMMREALVVIPSAIITVQQPSAIGGAEAPIQIEISGNELGKLFRISEKVRKKTLATKGSRNTDTTWRSGKPELIILPERRRLNDYNISVANFARILRTYIEGAVPSVYRVGNNEYDIRVKLDKGIYRSVDQIYSLYIPLPDGRNIPIENVAKLVHRKGPTQILRKNKKRMVMISTINGDRSMGEIANELQEFTGNLQLPPGYSIFYGGMIEQMGESFEELIMAFFMAVILSYLVLAGLLESFIQPFTIMMALPLAMVGVFTALYITGTRISIFSLMAIVMLVGIVINDAILLIDTATSLRKQGMNREKAILKSCQTRFKPVIMTSITAIIGMLPLAFGYGWGSEFRTPMAIVSIGGLVASTLLTLIVIPIIYTVMDDIYCFVFKKNEAPYKPGEFPQ